MPIGSNNPFPSVLVVEGTAPSSPSAGQQRVFIDSADHKFKRVNSSGTVTAIESTAAVSGSLIGRQIITATGAGTYTPTSGTSSVIIELIGAGGGGAGVASASGSQVNLGGGGGSGAYARKRLTANFSGASYSVGAKGTGGASGNNNGTDAGNTTFTDTAGSPTTYTAGGGKGGAFRGSFAPPITANPTTGGVGSGGVATNGDINVDGQDCLYGIAPNASVGWACNGGSHQYGKGGQAGFVSSGASTAGTAATGKGSGGGGACSTNAGGAKAGGDGSDGMIVIWEYA